MMAIVPVSLALGMLAVLYAMALGGKRWGNKFEAALEVWWLMPLVIMGLFIGFGAILIGAASLAFAALTALFL